MIRNLTSGLCALSLAAISVALAPCAQAQTIPLSLGGDTSFDQWTNLSVSRLHSGNGYYLGGFPGSGTWSGGPNGDGTIASNSGGGDAFIRKVRNGRDGGPYPASDSLYYGGMSGDSNVDGGTLAVVDNTPLANLKTVVFQLEIGGASGYYLYESSPDDPVDPFNGATPILYYTTGGNRIALDGPAFSFTLVNQVDYGIYETPNGPEPVFINTWAFQWDMSLITTEITSFEIEFTGVQHAQLYSLQLDQSSTSYQYNVAAIPEPGTWSLLFVVGVGSVILLRRNARLA